ncbi:MAG TPA: YceH family protein [Candidatus Acidoferrales bacterium]|nr:YceH family protein [Candidatus Acidoferrales bacterium]
MDILLNDIETRVLGALVEKELTTPEYYPLSLNALVNACNQKSNRDPAMNLDEDSVREAIRTLEKKGLAGPADNMVSRVTKYEHRLQEAYNFTRHETAILAELLLRGPQTPSELRTRADRMHKFDDLGIAQSTLQRLMKREPPIVKVLPRQPGTKEARYAHLLSGDVESPPQESAAGVAATSSAAGGDRIARLENQIEVVQSEIAELKQQFAAFRKQFE